MRDGTGSHFQGHLLMPCYYGNGKTKWIEELSGSQKHRLCFHMGCGRTPPGSTAGQWGSQNKREFVPSFVHQDLNSNHTTQSNQENQKRVYLQRNCIFGRCGQATLGQEQGTITTNHGPEETGRNWRELEGKNHVEKPQKEKQLLSFEETARPGQTSEREPGKECHDLILLPLFHATTRKPTLCAVITSSGSS